MQKITSVCLALTLLSGLILGCSGNANTETSSGVSNGPSSSAASSGASSERDLPKVAFVYLGTPSDGGWTYAHDMGRKYLEEKLGIQATVVENVPEGGTDAERIFGELAQDHDIIFGTSYGYMDPMLKVAGSHPGVVFEHNSGYKTAENMGTYYGREYQSAYLVGMAAGKVTKNNKLGYVGAFPIPGVIYTINAFMLGAQSVNPDVELSVVWSNTWYNPEQERQAAISLLDKGVDVLAAYQDSPASIMAAAERGVWGIGKDADMGQYAPDYYLTNAVWNWGPYYAEAVQSVIDGTWKPSSYWGSMSDGIVDIAPFGKNVPQEAKDVVEAKKKEILGGMFEVFKGPIYDQQGALRVQDGQAMTDEEILAMDWFVQGIGGTTE